MEPNLAYQAALDGVDYIGIVLAESSRRKVGTNQIHDIAAAAHQGGAQPILTCLNHPVDSIIHLCTENNINIVQLHGDLVRRNHLLLPQTIARIYVYNIDSKGHIINNDSSLESALNPERDYILFDSVNPGSGQRIPLDSIHHKSSHFRFFIAGGINKKNAVKIIKSCQPYAIDLSTGAENKHGHKDLNKIREIVALVKNQ